MPAQTVLLVGPPNPAAEVAGIQSGIVEALTGSDCSLTVAPFISGSAAAHGEFAALVARVRPVGAILAPGLSGVEIAVSALQAGGVPYIRISPQAEDNLARLVCSNDRLGMRDAANYLIALGHKKIGFVSISDKSATASERELGFLDALAEHGLEFGADLVVPADDTPEGACKAALLLMSLSPRPSAILASSDMQAAGVLQAARLRDIAVPAGLSVLGFGDGEIAQALAPPLTTMRLPHAEMGFTAAVRLLDPALAATQPVEFFCQLVVRESAAPPL